ncbi:TlpA disulfide reductase family protein [Dyella sp.]|uniref:TlpA family protein disulfide reductase n=1 Tax=Dyella sp. TaxID=1869338 RepID=UPI002D783FE3|nr:TlpA disulfide reductase family protein [Dyella sp.]HET6433293.1 TlpA disulfide reductase family protein [Dyella sp.]
MNKRFRRSMLALSLLAVAVPAIGRQITLEKFRAGMLVPNDTSVQFEDASGKPITFDQFVAAARGGSFSKDIDTEARKAVFRVNDRATLHKSAAKAPALDVTRGQPLPATELSTLAGERWTPVSKDGRYTLLSFYFDACVPCIAEIPALNAYARAHPEVRVLAVTFDGAVSARTFRATRHLEWPIAPDAQTFIDALGVRTYPVLLLVRPDGTLADSFTDARLESADGAARLAAWVHRAQSSMLR